MTREEIAQLELINNDQSDKKRFELHIEDKIAFMDYMIVRGNVMYLTHTEVPVGLEGKGVGSAIVSKVLKYIRENKYVMAPLCPFLASYLKKHPEMAKGILAPGFKIA